MRRKIVIHILQLSYNHEYSGLCGASFTVSAVKTQIFFQSQVLDWRMSFEFETIYWIPTRIYAELPFYVNCEGSTEYVLAPIIYSKASAL